MVSYYNSSTPMYRHQQGVQGAHPAPSWYPGYHHQPHHQPNFTSCMQPDEQGQVWHPHHGPTPGVPFANDFEYHHNFYHQFATPMHPPGVEPGAENQLPSPPITASGSEMSSPGGNSTPPGVQPNVRPAPARSPYDWIKKPSYQSQPNPGKTRTKDKYRVVYTDHQRIELEKEFTFHNKYITIRRKSELAVSLGLSERQIKIWFQNRRAKERKQIKKRAEEKNGLELSPSEQGMNNYQTILGNYHMMPDGKHEINGSVGQQINPMITNPHHLIDRERERLMKLEMGEDQIA